MLTTKDTKGTKPAFTKDLSYAIVGAALAVHKALGPGLLESAYEVCLAKELKANGIQFETQVPLTFMYRNEVVDASYRLDFLIENQIIVEIKSAEKLLPIHEAQLLSYLRLSGHDIGLLINFNVEILKNGIKRMRI